MLSLTRKKNQCIRIGNDIKIYFPRIDNNQVGVAIDAPKDLIIYREEVYQKLAEKGELDNFKKSRKHT